MSDLAVSILFQYNSEMFILVSLTSIQMLHALNIQRHFQTDVTRRFLVTASSVNLHRTTIATGNEMQSTEEQFVFVNDIWKYTYIKKGFFLYCTKNTSVPTMFLYLI